MTDPQSYVADAIGQQAAASVQGGPSQDDLARAAFAQSGLGVTEADIDAITAQLTSFQAQLRALQAQQAAQAPDALTSSVASLTTQLANHGDVDAIELGKDAAEAAKNATESGDTGPLEQIIARIARHLSRHPAGPGDQFHYQQALDTASQHVPDVISAFVPPSAAAAVGSSQPPAKVVAGSVVG